MPSKIRDIAEILGVTETANPDNTALGTGAGGGVTSYDSAGLLPYSGIDSGSLAYIGNIKRIYTWTGNEWYEIERLNNTNPSITLADTYTFDSSNAPDLTIDVQLTDPQLLDMYLDTVTFVPSNVVDSAITVSQDSDAGTITIGLQSGGTIRNFKGIFTAFEKSGVRSVIDSADFIIDRAGIIGLSKSVNSIDEGDAFTITATTRGISDSGNLNYSITGISDSDLSSGSLNGIIVINQDSGSVSFTTAIDALNDSENATIIVTTDENDSAQIVMPINNTLSETPMEVLIVGGGGSGGSRGGGGGGGAGEVVDLQSSAGFTLNPGVYTLTVGAGGVAPSPLHTGGRGGNGQNSVFMSIQALGGGAGGGVDYQSSAVLENANAGGSGGGATSTGTVGGAQQGAGGYNSYRFGNAGGLGSQGQNANYVGGGGGGAGASGGAGVAAQMSQRGPGGEGGVGRQVAITGTQVYYGGGGGGGGYCSSVGGGAGGLGGGGNGADSGNAQSGQTGQANTGGGGGGGDETCGSTSVAGGKTGGSGIVIVAIQQQQGSLTQIQGLQYSSSTSQRRGYTVYTFSGGSGTVTVQ
jgi:hypothetical protein